MDNLEEQLNELISRVGEICKGAVDAAVKRQNELAKPPGSLGMLESLSAQVAGITGKVSNKIEKKRLLVFCADNGVVCEGIASTPQSVTESQTVNLAHGKTGAAVIARELDCEVKVYDVGVNAEINDPCVISKKTAFGTKNIANGPAMTREQALEALLTGADAAVQSAKDGVNVLGIGEMGIGNTTTAAAVLSVISGKSVKEVTGRGAGLTDGAYAKKIKVIEKAIELNKPDKKDIIDVISKVGGFDIAAMTGAFIGSAAMRIPVVIDGFISIVAALCAYKLCPNVKDYLIPSHASYEIGYRAAVDLLEVEPLFDLKMRLGEGSGCPISMTVLQTACAVLNNMATFEEAKIDDSYLLPIRNNDSFTVKGD